MNISSLNSYLLYRYLFFSVMIVSLFNATAQQSYCAEEASNSSNNQIYAQRVLKDKPVIYWRFEEGFAGTLVNSAPTESAVADLEIKQQGDIQFSRTGPNPEKYPLFSKTNNVVNFKPNQGFFKITDPGENSPLDFDLGDSLTFEAWVHPQKITNGQAVYIFGKGRTRNEGYPSDNQNYAFRLLGKSGSVHLNFLFRSRDQERQWHRWSSSKGVVLGDGWHHVALTYTFGKEDSLRGYIDGKPVKGTWDFAGKTSKAPVVDDDELWIGTAQGHISGSTFNGAVDEIALYRHALTEEQIADHFEVILPKPYETPNELPEGKVLVEIMEGIPDNHSWDFITPKPNDRFLQEPLAFVAIPGKYNRKGILEDRKKPFLVRASSILEIPAGTHRLLLRSRTAARLLIDGEVVVSTPFPSNRGDGHNHVWEVSSEVAPGVRPLQPGDKETVAEFNTSGGQHRFQWELLPGTKGRRPELGESLISIELEGQSGFTLLEHFPASEYTLDDQGWEQFEKAQRQWLAEVNQNRRHEVSTEYRNQWAKRHSWVRDLISQTPGPELPPETSLPANNQLDRFINAGLIEHKLEPTQELDDWAFLRRVTVDLVGTIPTPELIEGFFSDQYANRRERYIDKLLMMPGWADNWIGYWQDVLAENPNVINPTLNNTGPFRWWLHESFSDNKPIDQLATELIMMEGSERYGGPAGFAAASQNDAPMAAKAHILGQAFLGVNLKCARCHDAPFHDLDQRDLFSLAAMLKRAPQVVPKTSTIPGDPETLQSMLVEVTLKPGEKITPVWPFENLAPSTFPEEMLQKQTDQREQLAWHITSPYNERFARVIVNRLWHRLMGRGFVEIVDDWEHADPSHPDLLEYLSRELMSNGYDLKHVTRLIVNSMAYQRQASSSPTMAEHFAAPKRRMMQAEQIVDSLFVSADKEFHTEDVNIDVDGSRQERLSINFGHPQRAWEFTSLSNERDRPSLSLPGVQTVVDVLENFGWRGSRQDPLTIREMEPSVLQSAILSNGVVGKRISQLSEDSRFTALAMQDLTLEEFTNQVYLAVMTRKPTEAESHLVAEMLSEGYETRRINGAVPGKKPLKPKRDGVSWSNHLKPESNELKVAYEKALLKGDPPTTLLEQDWRERAEDFIWSLINSPEYVLLP